MAVGIRLPDMGTNVEECKLLVWRVQEGARVKRGEVLAEIETDKAVAELESTAEGVLLRQVVKAGEQVHTGDVLAYVGQPGEPVPDATATVPAATAPAPAAAAPPSRPAPGTPLRISPVVRNLAARLGADLAVVRGTGTGGVITREDVLLASQATPGVPESGEPLARAQAAVARAVLMSWKEIPHLRISVLST